MNKPKADKAASKKTHSTSSRAASNGRAHLTADVAPPPLEAPTDARAAYEAMLADANQIDDADVGAYRLDPTLVAGSVKKTVSYLRDQWSEIPEHLPHVDRTALASLPILSAAVAFAAIEAERTEPSEKVVMDKLAEARLVRGRLLPVLKGLAANGLVPTHEAEDILRGRGARDIANDCVAIPECFRRHAAKIAGKHAASDEDLQAAAALGAFLQANLKSARSKPEKSSGPNDAVRIRNRLGALLVARHDLARRVGFYFEGELVDAFVPLLNARKAAPRTAAPTDPPAPATGPDPEPDPVTAPTTAPAS